MKDFKTIDELMALLNSRGVSVNDSTSARLQKESCCAVVNGYKRPFLDLKATEKE